MPIMKSLNLRFAVANIKAMEDLVKAGHYGSVADVVRAAVRDLLNKEYYGREVEISRLIALSGHSNSNDTYGSGDRAKGYKANHPKSAKPQSSVTTETETEETEEEPEGTMGIGGPVATSDSIPTLTVEKEPTEHTSEQEGA